MSAAERERRELIAGAQAMRFVLASEQLDTLSAFLDLVYGWNESAGLTAVARVDAARLHVLDSLSALPLLASTSELGDLGSGGGFPGIPLAIARPDLRLVLVEKRRRKCSFLREAVRELRLLNCEVHEGDAASLARAGGVFQTSIARAFLQPAELFPVLTGAARSLAIAMLGPTASEHSTTVPAGWEQDRRVELALPGGGERRLLIALRTTA